MHADWSPGRFTDALGAIQRATGWSQGDIARLAGINRSQVSRWMRGQHRPAYGNVRQVAVAVYRDDPDLAQELMASAGYAGLDDAAQAEPELVPTDEWEAGVLADPDLPEAWKVSLVRESRAARAEYVRLKRERRAGQARQESARSDRGTRAG